MKADRSVNKRTSWKKRAAGKAAAVLLGGCLVSALPGTPFGGMVTAEAAEGYEDTSSWEQMEDYANVLRYGMTPISGAYVADGNYEMPVTSSSKYFKLDYAVLHVEDGLMTAEVHFDSLAYEYVYPGSPEEAAAAELSEYIPCEDAGMETIFTFPVSALNEPLACAAYSKNRDKWYGRTILFDASELPADALSIAVPDYEQIEDALEAAGEDPEAMILALLENGSGQSIDTEDGTVAGDGAGNATDFGEDNAVISDSEAEVTEGSGEISNESAYDQAAVEIDLADGEYSIEADMSGGSGRATISSPMLLTVENGKAYATVLWSSRYYDYMIVNGRKYYNESEEGAPSSFTIPILAMDESFTVIADTTAMDEPIEIEYTLTFYENSVGSKGMIPQEAAKRVLVVAAFIIVIGGILNHFVQKRRER